MSKTSRAHNLAEKRFFAVVITFVISLGLFSFMSLLRDPTVRAVPVADNRSTTGAANRGPASLEEAMSVETPLTLNFDCSSPAKSKDVSTSHLRLKSDRCADVKDLQIINQSNGFTASLIYTNEKKEFTTDFIDLVEGSNRLKVSWQDAHGQKSEVDVVINKKPRVADLPSSL